MNRAEAADTRCLLRALEGWPITGDPLKAAHRLAVAAGKVDSGFGTSTPTLSAWPPTLLAVLLKLELEKEMKLRGYSSDYGTDYANRTD